MSAPLVKTKTPGVYKRGSRYTVVYRDADGNQRRESARTYAQGRDLKSKRQAAVTSGEFHQDSKERLHDYMRAWIKRYQGTGRKGFRANTRDEYTRVIEAYVLPYFGERKLLAAIHPKHVAEFIGWLCDEEEQDRVLADSTVKNIMAPLSACMSTAVQEGLIRSNPCTGVAMPHRPTAEGSEQEEVRAMNREQLGILLALIPRNSWLFFQLLAATGLRISEAVALQGRHLQLDGSSPHVKVRRGLVRGRMEPPKSKYGRRQVPIAPGLVQALREHVAAQGVGDLDLVFTSTTGTPLNSGNLRRRVLKPAAEEACLWSGFGFHAFRHTCASLLFDEGRNAKQVQRWLGHHSAAFTLATYVHLMDDDIGDALDIGADTVAPVTGDFAHGPIRAHVPHAKRPQVSAGTLS